MVVKPTNFIATGKRGLVQPAMKCRGAEYLRIIYGPEYTLPSNLDRLRNRGLSNKRSLALREFALGMEGLQRFVDREPLYRVHECAFAVLALESEPVDPRLLTTRARAVTRGVAEQSELRARWAVNLPYCQGLAGVPDPCTCRGYSGDSQRSQGHRRGP